MTESAGCLYTQAHRGYSATHPENTLLAFERALEAGVEQIELDVALTKDQHVVVIHDETLERTTNGQGLVSEHTLAELAHLDAGSWKDSAYQDQHIPTLEEVLERVSGQAWLNIEIKMHQHAPDWITKLTEKTLKLIRAHRAESWVVLASFDLRPLQLIRASAPDLKTMLIDWSDPMVSDGLEQAIKHGLYSWTPHHSFINKSRVMRAEQAGLVVQVDSEAHPRIVEWAGWGIRGVSADNPEALAAFLKQSGVCRGRAQCSVPLSGFSLGTATSG